MYIKSVYIYNFGCLNNYCYTFNESFNMIVEDNGFGKSTLAHFIKYMFYGFSSTKSKSLKRKFLPWNGSVNSGELVFCINESEYKIVRSYGGNLKKEEFTLYDNKTNKISYDYTSNIGYEIFNISSESFSKSVFLTQEELVSGYSDDITNKLSNLIESSSISLSYEQTRAKLEERKRKLYHNVNVGEISLLEKEIKQLSIVIKEKPSLTSRLDELTIELERLKEKITKNEELINKSSNELKMISEYKANLEIKKNYQKLVKEIEALKINKEIISQNELDLLNKYQSKLNSLKNSETHLLDQSNDIDVDYQELEKLINSINNNYQVTVKPIKLFKYSFLLIPTLFSIFLFVIFIENPISFIYLLAAIFFMIVAFLLFNKIKKKHQEKVNDELKRIEIIEKRNLELEAKIKVIFDKLKIEGSSNSEKLNVLNSVLNQQNIRKEKNNEQLKEIRKEITNLTTACQNLLKKYNIDLKTNLDEAINSFQKDIYEHQNKVELLKVKEQELKEFKMVEVKEIEVNEDLDLLINNLLNENKVLNNDIINKEKELLVINDKLDAIDIEYYDQKCKRLEELKVELEYVKTTITFIDLAKDNLSSTYLNPMKQKFFEYLNLIDQNIDGSLDTTLNISIRTPFGLKESTYYSSGYQDIFNLCLRLSLIDNIFKTEHPMIILDDPFINLDKSKLKSVYNVLSNLNNQIIYLTCDRKGD